VLLSEGLKGLSVLTSAICIQQIATLAPLA
jgi:hypothetical protein